MDTTEERLQRFVNECALMLQGLKEGRPLTEKELRLVKSHLYKLLFEIEAKRPSPEATNQQ